MCRYTSSLIIFNIVIKKSTILRIIKRLEHWLSSNIQKLESMDRKNWRNLKRVESSIKDTERRIRAIPRSTSWKNMRLQNADREFYSRMLSSDRRSHLSHSVKKNGVSLLSKRNKSSLSRSSVNLSRQSNRSSVAKIRITTSRKKMGANNIFFDTHSGRRKKSTPRLAAMMDGRVIDLNKLYDIDSSTNKSPHRGPHEHMRTEKKLNRSVVRKPATPRTNSMIKIPSKTKVSKRKKTPLKKKYQEHTQMISRNLNRTTLSITPGKEKRKKTNGNMALNLSSIRLSKRNSVRREGSAPKSSRMRIGFQPLKSIPPKKRIVADTKTKNNSRSISKARQSSKISKTAYDQLMRIDKIKSKTPTSSRLKKAKKVPIKKELNKRKTEIQAPIEIPKYQPRPVHPMQTSSTTLNWDLLYHEGVDFNRGRNCNQIRMSSEAVIPRVDCSLDTRRGFKFTHPRENIFSSKICCHLEEVSQSQISSPQLVGEKITCLLKEFIMKGGT